MLAFFRKFFHTSQTEIRTEWVCQLTKEILPISCIDDFLFQIICRSPQLHAIKSCLSVYRSRYLTILFAFKWRIQNLKTSSRLRIEKSGASAWSCWWNYRRRNTNKSYQDTAQQSAECKNDLPPNKGQTKIVHYGHFDDPVKKYHASERPDAYGSYDFSTAGSIRHLKIMEEF